MSIFDYYVRSAPDPQHAVDIFKGAWASAFPPPFEHLHAGSMMKHTDARIPWAAEQFGGVAGQSVLELGPLEGTMTCQLEALGAAEILGIEANTTAYLRCLITKEIVGLKHAQFVCGDFVPYLRPNPRRFDVCIASGVLYHMRNPAELLGLAARAADKLFIWTHYYDAAIIGANPNLTPRFSTSAPAEYQGFRYTQYRQQYQAETSWSGFCGGSAPYSNWMSRDDILACLRYFGFGDLRISFEGPDHHGGPSFAIAAIRTNPATVPQFVADEPAAPDELPANAAPIDAFLAAPAPAPDSATLQRLAAQDGYIARLEQALQQKNAHIQRLEGLIKRYEAGRLMRLLRRFGG